MNNEYQIVINELKNNINNIITLYKKQKEINKELTIEVNNLTNELQGFKEKFYETEKKYNNLKMAKLIENDSISSHEAKIKLNRIIREVDNCIALINR